MTPIKRSRRMQAGLAGLGMLSAVGAAIGLGLTTHTHSSTQPGTNSATGNGSRPTSQRVGDDGENGDGENDDGSGGAASSQQSSQQGSQQGSPVTPPSNTTPQATTSGS